VRDITERTPERGIITGIEGSEANLEANLLGISHPAVPAPQREVRNVESKIAARLVVDTAATESLSLLQGKSEAVGTAAPQGENGTVDPPGEGEDMNVGVSAVVDQERNVVTVAIGVALQVAHL